MMSRAQLTSTVEQSSGGVVAPFLAGKNKIINGDFGIWQRGTSGFATGGAYNADRWRTYCDGGGGATYSVSQQSLSAGAIAGVDTPYCWQLNQSVAGSGGTLNLLYQLIENVQTLAGQTATLSFYAKSDATRTALVPVVTQNFGSGGSSNASTTVTATASSPANLTTSWQRFSYNVVLPSISGKTIGTSSYVEIDIKLPINTTQTTQITGVQLEAGSVATPFTTASGTLQGELAACQRYYQRWTATAANAPIVNGCYYSSVFHAIYPFKVTMRTTPSMNASSYSQWSINAGTTYYNPGGSLGFGIITPDTTEFYVGTTSSPSGGTAGYLYAGLNSYVEMSAEL
jgi:hypothetical protein